jgi:glycosyltransferase involved in cell wall biosynthesis
MTKILGIGSYPIRVPVHGGQRRVAAIRDYYNSIGISYRYVGIFDPRYYRKEQIADDDIVFTAPKHLFPGVPFLDDLREGVGGANDRSVCLRLTQIVKTFSPDFIQIEQPFLLPTAEAVADNTRRIIYSSQNIEAPLKEEILRKAGVLANERRPIVELIDEIEKRAVRNSVGTICCSEHDATLARQRGATNVIVAPNGVERPRAVRSAAVAKVQEVFGGRPFLFVVGSGHPPNVEGVIKLVTRDGLHYLPPRKCLAICGGMGHTIYQDNSYQRFLRGNSVRTQFFADVDDDELAALKHQAHAMLLPIVSGGGSNLKTAEAIAMGKWIIATDFSMRGFDEYRGIDGLTIVNDENGFRRAAHQALQRPPLEVSDSERLLRNGVYWDECFLNSGLSKELASLASMLNRSAPPGARQKRMFVAISELVRRDAKTGVQRVVRSILTKLTNDNSKEYKIEPVYFSATDKRYRYARQFMWSLAGVDAGHVQDEPIQCLPGDMLFELDLDPTACGDRREVLGHLRENGAQVWFAIYDLQPVRTPHYFPDGLSEIFCDWLKMIGQSADGVACISQSVAKEVVEWFDEHPPVRLGQMAIGWFHLGADIENSRPTRGLPPSAGAVIAQMAARPSFLSVSTVEPRKGYVQLLLSFEQLWRDGVDANLIIVGKQGWNVEELVQRLRHHPEGGRRLFWLDGISDEYLECVYKASTCLIFASEGEGFGLPIIEAARHGLPLLLRDLPVFREIAGPHAAYFKGVAPPDLAGAVTDWLDLREKGEAPQSSGIRIQTWAESAEQLKGVLTGERTYRIWPEPSGVVDGVVGSNTDSFPSCSADGISDLGVSHE